MAVSAFAPASIGNVSVGFDILGAALKPIDGQILGDNVEVHDGDSEFSLEVKGWFADKLPSDPKKNIVYDAFVGFKKFMEFANWFWFRFKRSFNCCCRGRS